MGPTDTYSYYYNTNSTDQTGQSSYNGYPARSNQYSHSRPASTTTPQPSYNSYQQPQSTFRNDQTQQSYGQQNYYGAARDSGERAAETLSRLGTTSSSYPASTGAAGYAQPAPSNTYGTTYGTAASAQYNSNIPGQSSTYPSQSNYATSQPQSQPRPPSVNSARASLNHIRSPMTETTQPRSAYQRTQQNVGVSDVQRSASPAQIQASHQLQRLADQRTQETATASTGSTNTFVDPSAVYDPWPEYQRKLLAAQAAKDAEDRAAAEREAEEKRRAAEEKAEADRLAQEKAKQDLEQQERDKEAAEAKAKAASESSIKRTRKARAKTAEASGSTDMTKIAALSAAGGPDAEAQIRQLMAMVKSMNDQHPDLLAKIWEEERQSHMQQSSTAEPGAVQAEVSSAAMATAVEDTPTLQIKKKNKKEMKKDSSAVAEPRSTETVAKSGKKAAVSKATTSKATPYEASPTTFAAPTAPMTAPAALSICQPVSTPASASVKKAGKGTIWPPEKKGQLAAAASRWLNAQPVNSGRLITAAAIAQLLDENPTYIELCEMIEKTGLRVERAAFAKALLASVPDVNSNRPATSPNIPRPPSIASATSFPRPSGPVVSAAVDNQIAAPAAVPVLGVPVYDTPYFDAQGDAIRTAKSPPKEEKKKKKKKSGKENETKSEEPEPGPITKADQARKRTFADLVDLTALSDDDMPPNKQPYWGLPQPEDPLPGGVYSNALTEPSHMVDPFLLQQRNSFGSVTQASNKPPMSPLAFKLNNMELAKPLDKNFALRRSKYDIRTLARDVLLATGKHPDLLPLNGHLEPLRAAFPSAITHQSDLSTIRWDLIDPGDPVPAMLESMPQDDDSVMGDVDDDSEEEHRNFAVRRQAERVYVRQPVRVPIGSHGEEPTSTFSPNFESLERAKMVPLRGSGRPRARGHGVPPSVASFSTGSAQTTTGNHATPGSAYTASPASGGSGYSQFRRELNPDGTKKRGRPVGWRKHLHQRTHPGQPAPSGSASASKTSHTPQATLPRPNFAVYKCGWESCGAELENLKTLRKHAHKKHGENSKCQWVDCGKIVQSLNPETGAVSQSHTRYAFSTRHDLMKHLDDVHIGPIGWRLGDGPIGGLSDSNKSDSEPYLSDAQGRRVTPRIEQSSTPSAVPRQPGQRGRPPKKTDEEKARESLQQLAKQKKEIGLGVDREGATFANDKRRQGFVDDEEGEEVVDKSD